jgi:prepilin-type N-terminal cleavage/methylation domain-containing protein
MVKTTLKNQKGFTLIEIIAVLVILGILAAVAVPKYLSMADEARIKAAQGAIAEVKGRLSSAQGKYMMANGGLAPTNAALFDYATGTNGYGSQTNLSNVGADFVVTTTTGSPITISVSSVGGTAVSPAVNGNFAAAQ